MFLHRWIRKKKNWHGFMLYGNLVDNKSKSGSTAEVVEVGPAPPPWRDQPPAQPSPSDRGPARCPRKSSLDTRAFGVPPKLQSCHWRRQQTALTSVYNVNQNAGRNDGANPVTRLVKSDGGNSRVVGRPGLCSLSTGEKRSISLIKSNQIKSAS